MVNLTGKLHQHNANQPIDLLDPQQVWVVESGSIALFVITIDRDQIPGQRQYLCTIEPGEAMFGAMAATHQLLAVPLCTAEILALDPLCWQDLCHQQDPHIQTWLTIWLGHLAPILTTQPLPATALQAHNAAHYSLIDRQTLQVTEMCWVEMQSGTACWQGITEISLTDAALPLPSSMWLSSIGDVQIATRPLTQISPTALLAGLARFHACLLQSIQISNECQQ